MTLVQESQLTVAQGGLERRLEQHRSELTGYCYRMLGSPFEAEDAVQDTFLRAWRAYEKFEGRAAFRSWLYRIATNVCLDMLNGRKRRARRERPFSMSRHTFVAMRYSHDRNAARPSKRSNPFQARRNVSWTASSASNGEPSIR